jgi:hypothetical protein
MQIARLGNTTAATQLANVAPRTAALAPRGVTCDEANAPDDPHLHARLAWLVAADAEAERRARLRRSPREEEEALMIRRPLTTEQAFARFGLLLGTLPPAAIFVRLISAFHFPELVSLIFVPMLLVCALLGRRMGAQAGRGFDAGARGSWARTIITALEDACVWAAATGAAGGAIFFGVGAIFGFLCAFAVALPAFALFAAFHRTLARGGMIDARRLAPLAWGINAAIAALILSPNVMPY